MNTWYSTSNGKAFVIVAVFVGTVLAVGGCRRSGHGPPDIEYLDLMISYKLDAVLDEIEATDEQRDDFHFTKDWILDGIHADMEERGEDREFFINELKKDVPDSAVLHDFLDEKLEQKRLMAHEILQAVLELHSMLEPAQREKLFQMIEKRINHGPSGPMRMHHRHGLGFPFGMMGNKE